MLEESADTSSITAVPYPIGVCKNIEPSPWFVKADHLEITVSRSTSKLVTSQSHVAAVDCPYSGHGLAYSVEVQKIPTAFVLFILNCRHMQCLMGDSWSLMRKEGSLQREVGLVTAAGYQRNQDHRFGGDFHACAIERSDHGNSEGRTRDDTESRLAQGAATGERLARQFLRTLKGIVCREQGVGPPPENLKITVCEGQR